MTRFILFVISFLFYFSFAVAQDGINYQGAATDGNGDELTNQSISIRASVLSGSASGNLQWEETHTTNTDQFGLFNVVIGQGTNTTNGATANFDDMDWGSGNHFLKIEMDATGGTNYAMIGTTQMMSVPYALYAKSAGIDSTAIAAMIGSSSAGMGGGCDYKFPEGLDGTPIVWDLPGNDYTVPPGKNLYITSLSYNGTGEYVQIDGIEIHKGATDGKIMIVGSGSVVSTLSTTSNHWSNINGILVDANVTPLIWHLPGNDYTVPAGKNLYITSISSNGQGEYVQIDGAEVFYNNFNTELIIVGAGSVVSTISTTSSHWSNFNGYLVDENYFAGCGGGGGSSSASAGIMSVSTFGDTLTMNGQSIIVPGISFQNFSGDSVLDGSGNQYPIYEFSTAGTWMLEDLRTTNWSDGTAIDPATYGVNSPFSYAYNPEIAYDTNKNVCPTGWHVPTRQEWYDLVMLFGDLSDNWSTYCNVPISTNIQHFVNVDEMLGNGWSQYYPNTSGFNVSLSQWLPNAGYTMRYFASDSAPACNGSPGYWVVEFVAGGASTTFTTNWNSFFNTNPLNTQQLIRCKKD